MRFIVVISALVVLSPVVAFGDEPEEPDSEVRPKPALGVLEPLARGIPRGQIRAAAAALRAEAGRHPRFRLLAPPALGLRPMMLALGCPTVDDLCLKRVAKHMEARYLIAGITQPSPKGPVAHLRLFDAEVGRTVRTTVAAVADLSSPRAPSPSASLVVRELLGPGYPRLEVTASAAGALVFVNDKPVGKAPITLEEGLAEGHARVEVRAAGYEPWRRDVVLRLGDPVTLSAVLLPSAPPREPVAQPARPAYKKWWFWTVVGVVVVGGAATAYVVTRPPRAPTLAVEF